MTGETMFVGGPRHGRMIAGKPTEERERYRVPAASPKDEPVDYVATRVVLTFPDPKTGEPTGETWAAWLYVHPELYPDHPQRAQQLQGAWADAACRFYLMGYGTKTTGGKEAVVAGDAVAFVGWCEHGDCKDDPEHTFDTQRARADWMSFHQQLTRHTASWENRRG